MSPLLVDRRRFLALSGIGAGALGLAACAPAEQAPTLPPADIIRAADPEIQAAEDARAFSGNEVAHTLVAGEALSSAYGLVTGYATPTGISPVGPTLRAVAGDRMLIDVDNRLDAPTSVHWHGLRIRNDMDGSPPTTQPAIETGEVFPYRFIVPDPGTYWYHSHSGLQADRALFGALIVEDPHDASGADLDAVVVFDDWLAGRATPEEVLQALGGESAGHGGHEAHGGQAATDDSAAAWLVADGPGESALLGGPTQHIAYPLHLANGREIDDPERITVPAGARLRLRLINAAAETPYRIALGGHRMTVIAADGFDTQPIETDAVLLAPAQRVDVLLSVAFGSWPLAARVEGREGAALAVIRTADAVGDDPIGWAATSLPEHDRQVVHDAHLRPADHVVLPSRQVDQDWKIELRQAGNRYAWAIAGEDAGRLRPGIGDRVRIAMTNTSDMWHPMHLHGHTFAIREHGGLRRDTAIVLPGETITIEFDADNPGQWMLHCHNAYHFEAGMTASLFYIR